MVLFIGARSGSNLGVNSVEALPLLCGVLCSNATLQKDEDGLWECLGNTSERPLVVAAAKANIDSKETQTEYERVKENPFSSSRKMMSTLVANSISSPGRFPSASDDAQVCCLMHGDGDGDGDCGHSYCRIEWGWELERM